MKVSAILQDVLLDEESDAGTERPRRISAFCGFFFLTNSATRAFASFISN